MNKSKNLTIIMAVLFVGVMLFSCASSGQNIKTRFFEAERCSSNLSRAPEKQKYRSYWLGCIKSFIDVYEQDPSGPWAAAALYRAAVLYNELYRHSCLAADRDEAVDLFNRIIKRFPKSAYSSKAKNQLALLSKAGKKKKPVSASRSSQKARELFFMAEKCHKVLLKSSKKQKYRCFWKDCIKSYHSVYDYDPSGPWAAAGLYKAGELYLGLYRHSFKPDDRKQGISLLEKVMREFPKSAYSRKAAAKLELVNGKEPAGKPSGAPGPGKKKDAKAYTCAVPQKDTPSAAGPVTVEDVRFWSNPTYTRVVIDTDRQVSYSHNLLKYDPNRRKPKRLYVDLANCRLGKKISRKIPVDDDLLEKIRAGQFTKDSVRVVMDIKSFEDYNIFHLQNPFRIVIDIRGRNGKHAGASGLTVASIPSKGPKSLAQQLSLGVRRIVIDAGHGGKDGGAPGYFKGVWEKNITLALAKKLADKVRRDIGCEVILTRDSDRFLTLEERTAMANTRNADLFISIHANACRSSGAHGIETYILNIATDEDAMQVAARENATSTKNISDLQMILHDLMRNAKINESSRFAGCVQSSIYRQLKKRYSRINNKGVKQAPFYVLLGAQMPAILIETGFISNKMECKRLVNPQYQDRLCEGIAKGIKEYIDRTKKAM